MTNDDILAQLVKDIAPANPSEFYLGMHLAALIDLIMYNGEINPGTLDALCEGAEEALEYWRDKYDGYIQAAGEASAG